MGLLSNTVWDYYTFCTLIEIARQDELTARARALEYADTYAVPEDRVISAFVWDTRRRWAMTAIRAISRTKIAARAHVLGSASRTAFHRSGRSREGPTSTCDRWDTAAAGGDRSFSQ